MKNNLYVILILASIVVHGQNLVPNNSFETLTSCMTGQAQVYLAIPWDVAPNTGGASPDLFNACDPGMFNVPANVVGYQNAHSGDGYAGFYTFGYDCREFIEAQLISPLVAGVTYSVEAYVTPGEEAGIAVDGIGIYISTGPASGNGTFDPLPVTPQISNPANNIITDTSVWTLVSGLYVATGGEDHITIGNFLDDVSTDTFLFNPVGWSRGYYFVDDVSVTEIQTIPVALFNAPNHICPGTCTNFTNLSTGATSYLWNFPGGNPSVSTDISPASICYNIPGNYDVTLIASNGNNSDTLVMNNFMTVYPSPPPQGIMQSGDTLFANAGASSYQWYYNGNIINGATDYFYVATESGDYNVVATDENGCEVEAVINDVLASAQAAVGSGSMQSIQVYPNPVTETFTVKRSTFIGTTGEISIYNVIGEKIYSSVHNDSNQELNVDCRSFRAGLYYLQIHQNEKIYRTKFMKQ